MRAALLLACALQIVALPAFAELRYFYCYVPDATSGTVYVSDIQPVGPVAERAAYGAEFLAYLKSKGIATSAQLGYCTMRTTESEVHQGQRDLLSGCRECTGATRLSSVPWNRRTTAESRGNPHVPSNEIQERYEESVRNTIRLNDPGVCYASADGSVRCTKGQATSAQVTAPASRTAQESSVDESAPTAARGELCVTDPSGTTARRQDCINKKPAAGEPAKAAGTTTPSIKKRPKPPSPPIAEAPSESSPAPSPPQRKTQACTTLPREIDTVIVVVKPEIFVTMTPGTFLYMRDHLGNELKLGYGNHRVRPGTYKLGIYGVTDPLNPLKQTLQACVAYYTDF